MTSKAVVGPVLADLEKIGEGNVTLATAFYSEKALSKLDLKANKLRLLVRLNRSSVFEWAAGAIDPAALVDFIERHVEQCGSVSLAISSWAHAKIYRGDKGYLIGSANLTSRGFSGSGHEVLWFESDKERMRSMDSAIVQYERGFSSFELGELRDYVNSHKAAARALSKKLPPDAISKEDKVPEKIARPARLGDYEDFLKWLDHQSGDAAEEIAARAAGRGHLSGHIRQNFFGLRQFFLQHPKEMKYFAGLNPESYSLSRDTPAKAALDSFARGDASDEGPFSVSIWRTYLPEYAGGKPKTGGGTSGNLNRMLPLVARYVRASVR